MNNYETFDFYDFKHKKANYHTHTKRCKHAVGEEREYVEAAIEAGFQVLGFADHTPYPFDASFVSPMRMSMSELEGYVDVVLALKKEYENDICILLGLETEYFPEYFDKLMCEVRQYPLDYMILAQHYLDSELTGKQVGIPTDEEAFLMQYVNQVLEGIHTGYFKYIAHPDMINYIGREEVYVKYMKQLATEMKKWNIPVEINVNGYRDHRNYPNERFLDIAVEVGNDFIIGVDAHSPNALTDVENYNKCIELVRCRGGNIISI